jgi:hypothetical protein
MPSLYETGHVLEYRVLRLELRNKTQIAEHKGITGIASAGSVAEACKSLARRAAYEYVERALAEAESPPKRVRIEVGDVSSLNIDAQISLVCVGSAFVDLDCSENVEASAAKPEAGATRTREQIDDSESLLAARPDGTPWATLSILRILCF